MLPNELIITILEFYGKIKYTKGKYIDIIHKYDYRYDIVKSIIEKKIKILKTIELRNNSFYFAFSFDSINNVGLCYDYCFSSANEFEICYYDIRNNDFIQLRTYI